MSKVDLSRIRLEPHEKQTPSGINRRRLYVILIVVLCIIIIFALQISSPWKTSSNEISAETQSVASDRSDRTGVSTGRAVGAEVTAGGYVEPLRSAVLLPGNDGVVTKVHVSLGDYVKKDQLLLELESEPAIAEVAMAEAEQSRANAHLTKMRAGSRFEEIESAQAEAEATEAELAYARSELIRLVTLDSSRAVSPAAVEEARSRVSVLESRAVSLRAREHLLRRGNRIEDIEAAEADLSKAEAALRLARARLALSRVTAPFDGRIMRVNLEVGDIVSRFGSFNRQIGIEIADLSEMWVRVDVPETRISFVRMGAAAEVVVDAIGSERLQASVVEIAPIADRQSNTVEVAVRVENPPLHLSPNMSARVTIMTSDQNNE